MTDLADESLFDCSFSDAARDAGRELFDTGKIRLREQTRPDQYEARVPFFRRFHTVVLQLLPDGKADQHCTCADFSNGGEGCAHVYGLWLAVQERHGEEEDDDEDTVPLVLHLVLEGGPGPLRVSTHSLEEGDEAPRPCPMDAERLARAEDADDLAALRLLAPFAGGRKSLYDGGGFARPEGPWELATERAAELLPRFAQAERLWVRGGEGELRSVRLDPGAEFELVLRIEADDARPDTWTMRGLLLRGAEEVRIETADLIAPGDPALVCVGGRLAGLESHGAADWVKLLMGGRPAPVPRDEVPAFVERLAKSGTFPRIWPLGAAAPTPLRSGTPEGKLSVRDEDGDLVCSLAFLYGEEEVAPGAPDRLLWAGGDPPAQVTRDRTAEQALLDRFHALAAEAHPELSGSYIMDWHGFVEDLPVLMDDGFHVEFARRPIKRSSGKRFSMRKDGARIRLEGGALFDDHEVPLPAVLQASRDGEPFLQLEDGSLGLVPREWPGKFEPLVALGELQDDGIAFHTAQGLLVEQALAGDDVLRPPKDLAKLKRALEALASPPTAPQPEGFVGELRSYQKTGLGWLQALAEAELGGCLADDMGLGKTVQVAALLLGRRRESEAERMPALVVVPRSLLFNWEQELARFAPALSVVRYAGPGRDRRRAGLADHDVVLTTYGTLRRDVEKLADLPLSALVLDEAQAIKNPASQSARAVRSLEAPLRLSVTGTPVENHLSDFWSQMEFLNPGLLGPQRRFLETMGSREAAGTRAMMARTLRPLILRRTKEEVAPDLPEKIEQVLHAPLAEGQAELYHAIRRRVRADLRRRADEEGLRANRMHVLEGLLRLRQAACHPGLVEEIRSDEPSGKLDLLMQRLDEVLEGGHKALVFSQFTTFLSLVRDRLEKEGHAFAWLDGKTRRREEVVRRFQEDPSCPLFLLSLKAGGVGLNLTAADYVFLLDPWWNPAVEAQAVDRAHRIGREGKVMAFRLVARGTIEEKVLELQEQKRGLVDDLLGAEASSLGDLDEDDLALLLGD